MSWRPGPQPSLPLSNPNFDERDLWTQRFITKTDDGELSLDVNAMNGPETAAGATFVELIRQQAERPFSPPELALSSWMPGRETGRQNLQHPPALRVDLPMAQYEPFRRTYVSDPVCVPQLRFANVQDAGADHHKRETSHHWRRSGRTWSRVPRFRKGESAFTHDPSYKPPHAVVDKWYRTDAGPKVSLAGRVEESRWQSCHSMQSGRESRQPTRSGLPRGLGGPAAGPGPGSYHIRDPWEVREVCGAVPKSRMFCGPVHRIRPQTTAFATAPTGSRVSSCDMSVDTAASPASACGDSSSAFGAREKDRAARPMTSAVVHPGYTADASPAGSKNASAAATASRHLRSKGRPQFCGSRNGPRRIQRSGGGGGGGYLGGRPRTKPASRRHRSGPETLAAAVVRAAARTRAPAVGPSSFARAERPNVTEECARKEESYGKKVVRLLTREGDVLVTVTRRRDSAWGADEEHEPSDLRPSRSGPVAAARERINTTAGAGAAAMAPRSGDEETSKKFVGRQGNASAGGGASARHNCNGREKREPSRNSTRVGRSRIDGGGRSDGVGMPRDTSSNARQTAAAGVHAHIKRGSTLEAKAMRLLPDDLAAAPPAYREPGRAELPLVFRATSVPLVRAGASTSREAEILHRRRTTHRASRTGVTTNPDGNNGRDVSLPRPAGSGIDEWRQEPGRKSGDEEAAYMARIVRAAEGIVAKSSSCARDGRENADMAKKGGVQTEVPAPSGTASGHDSAAAAAAAAAFHGGATGERC